MAGADARELAARWWKWADAAPSGRSPVRDATGEHAHRGQPSDVWFLAGTYGGRVVRRCTVPTDRPLFFPVLNTRRLALGFSARPSRIATSRAEAELNGIPLPVREAASKRFWSVGPQVAWGLWSTIDPLLPGDYVLSVTAKTETGDFRVDTTYHLTAVPSDPHRQDAPGA
ncbi:hypothetical protein ACIQWR_26210 [Streptomyces sp. NPDC098789]|uniref:hypothetical protein n=1 Tax=Streptomyces sp. NPDC098789 TaxID=3366098 RepID=UPI0038142567